MEIRIHFDKDGNFVDNKVTGNISKFPYLVLSDNEIRDNHVFSSGYGLPPNLFKDETTCIGIIENLSVSLHPSNCPVINLEKIPDWIYYNIHTDEGSKSTKVQYLSDYYGGHWVNAEKYDRTTTFSVRPQSENGTSRSFTCIAARGYYTATLHELKLFIDEGTDSDDFLTVIIEQDGYNGEGQIYSNPYYVARKDGVLVKREEVLQGNAQINIQISADGTSYNINELSLARKQYVDGVDYGIVNIVNSIDDITNVPEWVSYTLEDEEDLEEFIFTKWIKLSYNSNTSTSPRQGTIVVEYKSKKGNNYVRYEIHLSQEGSSVSPDIPDEKSSLKFKYTQITLPASVSSEDFATLFYYSNIDVNKLEVSSSEEWLSANIDSLTLGVTEGYVKCSWEANENTGDRTAVITLSGESTIDGKTLSTTIEVTQSGNGSGGDEPSEGDITGTFVVIDANTGENYDSKALLYKDTIANIYSTLEAKDNTLFLGNYLNSDFSLEIKSILEDCTFNIGETRIDTPIASINSTAYSYTPDMSLSSQQKRLFKRGEKYSLGFVFIKKGGTKSSVFYVGDFSPSYEPVITTSGGNYYLGKPQAYVTLNKNVVSGLVNRDVIGVIPVVAERGSHKIICQGFLNPTISSANRRSSENLTSQYNWFQRLELNNSTTALGEGESIHKNYAEFQSRDDDDRWTFNSSILTMNTPELEASDLLTNTELESCVIQPLWKSETINYTNSVQLSVSGKYLHSRVELPTNGYSTGRRETSLDMWYGFVDKGTENENTSAQFIVNTKDRLNYHRFFIYPWQRNTVGGEGPESFINSKKYFTSMYIASASNVGDNTITNLDTLSKASIYRDNFPSLLKFGNDIYQGNVDYIINVTNPYKAFITDTYSIEGEGQSYNYPKAHTDVGVYSGYSTTGEITDPIYMRYKVSPHVVLHFDNPVVANVNRVITAELLHKDDSYIFENDPQVLSSLTWIKCGDIVPLENNATTVSFTEGDYFYGRFDTLRTYPYSQEDSNSITDIVSGMLCSRINLDARCDRNRGIGTALVTPENFNRFNDVYNQPNNYFTFQYFNLTDKIYERTFSNSIQWSMPKSYGDEIDSWCNIQDINTLDLDGDKGELKALKRLANNIIAFQDTGISQILYNETMQIASSNGVPIEIGNSGRVDGKRYIQETIGCQNEESIASTPQGLYFIDGINKSFYRLGINGSMTDLCTKGGMKSWGLSNIDDSWVCWYDIYSKEVILTNPDNSLIYSDVLDMFQCFASYANIKHTFSLNGVTYLFKETTKIEEGTEYIYSNLWQKNAIGASTFFDIPGPIEIEIVANPAPTTDKVFTNIEYRADGFKNGSYILDATFKTLKVWNEYQDTDVVSLFKAQTPSNLKKKFRVWHISIPRSKGTTDRIRNPWCNIKLTTDTQGLDKFIVHDIQVQYLQL